MSLPGKKNGVSVLELTEEGKGIFVAENIYEGTDDFFAAESSAAYEYDDGRNDSYPLSYGEPEKS